MDGEERGGEGKVLFRDVARALSRPLVFNWVKLWIGRVDDCKWNKLPFVPLLIGLTKVETPNPHWHIPQSNGWREFFCSVLPNRFLISSLDSTRCSSMWIAPINSSSIKKVVACEWKIDFQSLVWKFWQHKSFPFITRTQSLTNVKANLLPKKLFRSIAWLLEIIYIFRTLPYSAEHRQTTASCSLSLRIKAFDKHAKAHKKHLKSAKSWIFQLASSCHE